MKRIRMNCRKIDRFCAPELYSMLNWIDLSTYWIKVCLISVKSVLIFTANILVQNLITNLVKVSINYKLIHKESELPMFGSISGFILILLLARSEESIAKQLSDICDFWQRDWPEIGQRLAKNQRISWITIHVSNQWHKKWFLIHWLETSCKKVDSWFTDSKQRLKKVDFWFFSSKQSPEKVDSRFTDSRFTWFLIHSILDSLISRNKGGGNFWPSTIYK